MPEKTQRCRCSCVLPCDLQSRVVLPGGCRQRRGAGGGGWAVSPGVSDRARVSVSVRFGTVWRHSSTARVFPKGGGVAYLCVCVLECLCVRACVRMHVYVFPHKQAFLNNATNSCCLHEVPAHELYFPGYMLILNRYTGTLSCHWWHIMYYGFPCWDPLGVLSVMAEEAASPGTDWQFI